LPEFEATWKLYSQARGLLALDVRWQVGRSDQMCDKVVAALTSRQDAMATPESSIYIDYLRYNILSGVLLRQSNNQR